jgi:hypothetical protein
VEERVDGGQRRKKDKRRLAEVALGKREVEQAFPLWKSASAAGLQCGTTPWKETWRQWS